jgi:hypothetical protein
VCDRPDVGIGGQAACDQREILSVGGAVEAVIGGDQDHALATTRCGMRVELPREMIG